jgi:hypothetical protein
MVRQARQCFINVTPKQVVESLNPDKNLLLLCNTILNLKQIMTICPVLNVDNLTLNLVHQSRTFNVIHVESLDILQGLVARKQIVVNNTVVVEDETSTQTDRLSPTSTTDLIAHAKSILASWNC